MFDLHSHGQVFRGQIGWDDEEDFFFPGTMIGDQESPTLVRCQLFSGRDITKPFTPERAQGTRLICHIPDGMVRIPTKNTHCFIIIPHGEEGVPASGLIIATLTPGAERQRNMTPGDTVITAPGGGQASIILKQDGSIVLFTTMDNTQSGKAVALELSSSKIAFSAPWGSFVLDATGYHLKTKAGPRIDMGGVTIPGIPSTVSDILSGYITLSAPHTKLNSALVNLGAGPVYGTALQAPISAYVLPVPVTTGPTSQSTSVWITTP